MVTVTAIVVTRNRPALLKRCLAAIDAQTHPPKQIVVVDNASDQPTRDLLAGEATRRDATFHVIRSEENTGGAGGFHIGMRASLSLTCTHFWLMDDDCEPDRKALEELVAAMAIVGEDAVLGGNVFDINGECINVQSVAQRLGANGYAQYPLYLANGLCEMGMLTFVSFLVPVKLVWKVGLPLKEFFIWGDDHEYSLRLSKVTRIYQVGRSKVDHLKFGRVTPSIVNEEDYNKIWQYRWLYRNRIFSNAEIRRDIFNATDKIPIQVIQRTNFIYSKQEICPDEMKNDYPRTLRWICLFGADGWEKLVEYLRWARRRSD